MAATTLTAYDTFGGHKLSGGVYGRYYWLDGSIDSTLASEIFSAKWSWGNATSAVAWAATNSKSASALEFYESTTLLSLGACGYAPVYNSSGVQIDPETSNWSKGKVLLSDHLGDSGWAYIQGIWQPYDCGNTRGVIVHEMGHTMGLAHEYHPETAIMRYEIAQLTWEAPKLDDVEGIEALY